GAQSALNLVDMMNGPETIAERRAAAAAAGRPTDNASVFTPDELPQVECATDAAYRAAHPGCSTGTDWQRRVLRTGRQQRHPLGLPYDSAGVPSATPCGVCTLKLKPTPDPLRVNPLRQEQGFVRQQTRNRLFGAAFAELQLGRGFAYRVNFGPDLGNRMDGQFQGANVVFNGTPIGNAQAQRADVEEFAYTLDQLLTWNGNLGNHRFDVTALYGIQSDNTTTDTVAAQNLPYDSQLWYNLGTGENPQPPRSSLSVWKLASYMGRINYTFKNRYLLDRKSTRLNSSH